jgi:D-hydroxyproline dehydrogenase subunit beta
VSASFDVVIVGGGIIGTACALECVSAGLRTALVEANRIAGAATRAAMGHLVVMDDSEPEFALTRYGLELWGAAVAELSARCEYRRAGTVWVAADQEEMNEAKRRCAYLTRHGVRAELLNEPNLQELEPKLRNELAGGLLVPDDAIVDAAAAAEEFCRRAEAKGARVLLGARAVSLDNAGLKLAGGALLEAEFLVNAAGARSSVLTPSLPVRPRKGQVVVADGYPGFVHQVAELGYLTSAHNMAADSVAFNIQPRRGGQLLIGSSRQYSDEETQVDEAMLGAMVARAVHYVPDLAGVKTDRVVTGLRAATPDKLPFIGKVPGHRRVLAATGHEGLGITTSLATARLLVDELLGRPSAIDRRPYSPSRLH